MPSVGGSDGEFSLLPLWPPHLHHGCDPAPSPCMPGVSTFGSPPAWAVTGPFGCWSGGRGKWGLHPATFSRPSSTDLVYLNPRF